MNPLSNGRLRFLPIYPTTCQVRSYNSSRCQVQRFEYLGDDTVSELIPTDIQLVEHVACECRCRVQAVDCVPTIQIYDPTTCICHCINESLASTCSPQQVWDPKQCSCRCPKVLFCLQDEYFNYGSCR